MNGYELIMKIQQRMQQDSDFANKFNRIVAELNTIPGLQQQVIKIAQISDDKKRQKAIERLPDKARKSVQDIIDMLNS